MRAVVRHMRELREGERVSRERLVYAQLVHETRRRTPAEEVLAGSFDGMMKRLETEVAAAMAHVGGVLHASVKAMVDALGQITLKVNVTTDHPLDQMQVSVGFNDEDGDGSIPRDG